MQSGTLPRICGWPALGGEERSDEESLTLQARVTSRGCCFSLPCYFTASLLLQLAQEASSMGNRRTEILSDGLPHIRQRIPHAQVHACPASRRIRQNRHVLPRVVRRRPARVG